MSYNVNIGGHVKDPAVYDRVQEVLRRHAADIVEEIQALTGPDDEPDLITDFLAARPHQKR